MRAFNLSAGMPYSLDLVDAPRPVPQPGEVLVRLQAAGLNYLDLVVATGRFANPPPSFVPGTDGAGEIVDLGEQVSSWAIGDKVILGYIVDWANGPLRPGVAERLRGVTMPGSLAECAVVPATSLVRMPSALSYAEAATLPIAATTAWNAIVAGNIRPGSTVALLGTGGVSLFALQFAKAAGARVVISSSSDEKLARARALGADVTINYRTTPAWDEALLAATEGRGADLVIETVGPATFTRSLNAAAFGATIYMVGFISGMELSLPILAMSMKTLRLVGSQTGSTSDLASATRAIDVNRIKPVVDRVFGFNDALAAYGYLEAAGHFGKVVIAIDTA